MMGRGRTVRVSSSIRLTWMRWSRPIIWCAKIGDMVRDVLSRGTLGMIPPNDQQVRDRAARKASSRRAAIICMAASTACFMVSLYLWTNSVQELDVSALKPVATTELAK